MPYTRWSPTFTPLKTHQFEIDTPQLCYETVLGYDAVEQTLR
jgi:hypothetical protein